ncbi:Tn3 family transposase [Amycolatopsis sp. FDAARGOS 1241]|nr:Tn3 family transposase [Amycolatopsis sp. FDAARGOS 1241]
MDVHARDRHTTYGTKIIVATKREAHYVLDEILGNATDIPITEHATDTHGVTLVDYGLFDLLGLQLSPRISGPGQDHPVSDRAEVGGRVGVPADRALLNGLDSARARGRVGGRPRVVDADKRRVILRPSHQRRVHPHHRPHHPAVRRYRPQRPRRPQRHQQLNHCWSAISARFSAGTTGTPRRLTTAQPVDLRRRRPGLAVPARARPPYPQARRHAPTSERRTAYSRAGGLRVLAKELHG